MKSSSTHTANLGCLCNNKQTSTPSKHLLSAKTYFLTCWAFFTQKQTSVQNTFVLFSRLFVFSNGSIFFCRLEKTLANHRGSVLARNVFPFPALLWKNHFLPERLLDLFLLTLCISFFHSPRMYCLSRGETNEMTTRIFAEKEKASGFLKTTTTSKPPRQVSIYCPLKHIF